MMAGEGGCSDAQSCVRCPAECAAAQGGCWAALVALCRPLEAAAAVPPAHRAGALCAAHAAAARGRTPRPCQRVRDHAIAQNTHLDQRFACPEPCWCSAHAEALPYSVAWEAVLWRMGFQHSNPQVRPCSILLHRSHDIALRFMRRLAVNQLRSSEAAAAARQLSSCLISTHVVVQVARFVALTFMACCQPKADFGSTFVLDDLLPALVRAVALPGGVWPAERLLGYLGPTDQLPLS